MKGDRAKYVGLCAALLVPAFVEGYAPSLLAKALEGEKIDFVQIALFVMIQSAAIGGSLALDKASRDFFTKNFAKKEGVGSMIAENVSAMPADRTNSVGPEKVRSRIAEARVGFEMIYRTVGFDILPSMITLATSAVMLYQRSPLLAASTAGGTGLVMALDAYADKLTGWWPKKRKAQNTRDKLNKNLDEQMNAHMEIVLSGQKDELEARIEKLLSEERAANANQRFAEVIRYKLNEMYGTLNLLMAGAATAISAGSPSNFIAAMAYSGNFYQGINSILRAKHHLLDAVHNIRVLELLFNGYAEEEKEKEKKTQSATGNSATPPPSPSSIKETVDESFAKVKESYQLFIEMSNFVRKLL
jgi:ABC-type multidrug transport system fused ATPase/permease subunit